MELRNEINDLHGESDDHNAEEGDDEWAALSHTVGDVCYDHSKNSSCNVDRHRHQLSFAR
jgi:hypothetical protein